VPRQTLLTALQQRMNLCTTMDFPGGTSHLEVSAPAVGDAQFTKV